MLLSVLYISYMTKDYEKKELDELMSVFYLNNMKHDISGLLLYSNKNVLQYIEGDLDKIEKLYNNIQNDNRHKSIITLYKKEIQQREFPHWVAKINYVNYNDFIDFAELSSLKDTKLNKLFHSFIITNRISN